MCSRLGAAWTASPVGPRRPAASARPAVRAQTRLPSARCTLSTALPDPRQACTRAALAARSGRKARLRAAQAASLQDGGGRRPAYNLRTLCRALEYARAALPTYGLQRALYDGAAMAFLTQLAPASAPVLERLLRAHLLGGARSLKARARAPCRAAASTSPHHIPVL